MEAERHRERDKKRERERGRKGEKERIGKGLFGRLEQFKRTDVVFIQNHVLNDNTVGLHGHQYS